MEATGLLLYVIVCPLLIIYAFLSLIILAFKKDFIKSPMGRFQLISTALITFFSGYFLSIYLYSGLSFVSTAPISILGTIVGVIAGILLIISAFRQSRQHFISALLVLGSGLISIRILGDLWLTVDNLIILVALSIAISIILSLVGLYASDQKRRSNLWKAAIISPFAIYCIFYLFIAIL